jgi:hypothetical protein
MNGQYPRFKNSYFYEELTEHFLLTTAEVECRPLAALKRLQRAPKCFQRDQVSESV